MQTDFGSSSADITPSSNEKIINVPDTMARTYDYYFRCEEYRNRYPAPNFATLDYVLEHGAAQASEILDFGCGNGRYALALLERTGARVTGYDISRAALAEFHSMLRDMPFRDRVNLMHGEPERLACSPKFDLALMLFGVLSHIGDRAARIDALRRIRSVLREDGRLIVSVPNIFRRRPFELLKFACRRRLGWAKAPQDEEGNILFSRRINHQPVVFFYHLYSVRSLRRELAQAGFDLRFCKAESVLPEWLVTQSSLARRIDRLAQKLLPAWLGYGICAVADPR